jgi:hypothetical protein
VLYLIVGIKIGIDFRSIIQDETATSYSSGLSNNETVLSSLKIKSGSTLLSFAGIVEPSLLINTV